MQFSTTVRNGRLDRIETDVGTAPKLLLFSGAVAANCAAADPAGLLATINLPSDWMSAAASGVKAIANAPWTGTGSAAGVIASYRIKDTALTTCHIQGPVTATGGGGEMTVDNTNVAIGQTINVTGFSITDGNA